MDTLGPQKLVLNTVEPLYNGPLKLVLNTENLSIMDTLGPPKWVLNTVEPLYNGHVGTSEIGP